MLRSGCFASSSGLENLGMLPLFQKVPSVIQHTTHRSFFLRGFDAKTNHELSDQQQMALVTTQTICSGMRQLRYFPCFQQPICGGPQRQPSLCFQMSWTVHANQPCLRAQKKAIEVIGFGHSGIVFRCLARFPTDPKMWLTTSVWINARRVDGGHRNRMRLPA